MPPIVKKGMSVTILTSIFTFLGITILTIFGQTTVKAHDESIKAEYVRGQMETMNASMIEFIAYTHEVRTKVATHDIRIEHCEEDIKYCKEKLK